VGTSLKILEREGYIARSLERVGRAYLKIKNEIEKIKNNFNLGKTKKQKEIIEKLIDKFGNELTAGWQVNLDEVADILQVKKESLLRLIRQLADADLLEYIPPFRGTELKILKSVDGADVKLDFAALKYKLKHAYKKLDLMENYIYHFDCRQKYILDYFGELEARACAKCDNCLVSKMGEVERVQVEARHKKKISNLSTKLTQLETLELWNKGMSLEKIAQARELAIGTVIGHLCFLVEKGLGVKIDKLVKPERQKKIMAAVKAVGADKLTPIREALGEEFSWDEIKLVVAKMKAHSS
jgi:ATP-dependent DNA helicase RecQ